MYIKKRSRDFSLLLINLWFVESCARIFFAAYAASRWNRWNLVLYLFILLIGRLSISHAFPFLRHSWYYSFGASLTSRNNLSFYLTIAILSCFTGMRILIRQPDAAISLCCFRSSFSSLSFLGRHMCQKRGTSYYLRQRDDAKRK